MKKLSWYLYRHKFGYLFVFVSMVIAVSLDLLSPQVTRVIVDDVIQKGETGKLRFLLPCLLLIGLGRCIFGYTKEYTSDLIGSSHRHGDPQGPVHLPAVSERGLF